MTTTMGHCHDGEVVVGIEVVLTTTMVMVLLVVLVVMVMTRVVIKMMVVVMPYPHPLSPRLLSVSTPGTRYANTSFPLYASLPPPYGRDSSKGW